MIPKECHLGQYDFLELVDRKEYRYYVVPCGRRFGKSTMVTDVEAPLVEPALLGNRVAIYVPDLKFGSRLFENAKLIYAKHVLKKSDIAKVIEFKSGGELHLYSINDERKKESGRGEGFVRVIYDECGIYDDAILQYHFEKVTQPTLLDNLDSDCFFLGTANHQLSFFHTLFRRGLQQSEHDSIAFLDETGDKVFKNYFSYRLPSNSNPTLDQAFLSDMALTMSSDAYKSEILCHFLNYGENIWCSALKIDGVKEKVFVRNTVVHPSQMMLLSFDMNLTPMTCILGQIEPGNQVGVAENYLFPNRITIKKEFCTDESKKETIYDVCRLIREYIFEISGIKIGIWDGLQYGCPLPIFITGDATSNRGDGRQKEPESYYAIISEQLGVALTMFNVPSINPTHAESYVQVNSTMDRSDHLKIDMGMCPKLCEDIMMTKSNPDRTIYKKDLKRGHFLDTLRYMLNTYNKQKVGF